MASWQSPGEHIVPGGVVGIPPGTRNFGLAKRLYCGFTLESALRALYFNFACVHQKCIIIVYHLYIMLQLPIVSDPIHSSHNPVDDRIHV
jgi:hypothetical protein